MNSLTNFADINYQISYALLSDKIDSLNFERLKNMYLTAKQYDLKIDNSFKFINLYMLIMHRVYIRAIPEVEKIKDTPIDIKDKDRENT